MTTKVFIAGSLTIRQIAPEVEARIDRIVAQSLDVVVGDADGVDLSIQSLLQQRGHARTTIYCSGGTPRHNVGGWPVFHVESQDRPGSRAFFTAKDRRMAEAADVGLMIWDRRSTGTLSNVLELLHHHKKAVVFVHADRAFRTIATVDQLEQLIALMAEPARKAADQKINLSDRLLRLRQAPLLN